MNEQFKRLFMFTFDRLIARFGIPEANRLRRWQGLKVVSCMVYGKVISTRIRSTFASFLLLSSEVETSFGSLFGESLVAYDPHRHQDTIPWRRRSPSARADLSAYLYFFIMNF